MRETRPFGQALLLSGFIITLLSILLPWWISYSALQYQEQQIDDRLTQLTAVESPAILLPGMAELSTEQPLAADNPAWWFGQMAGNHQRIMGQTTVFYRLDTRPATMRWLQLSAPLTLTTLLIFTALYRRNRKEDETKTHYFKSLLLDPDVGHIGSSDPIELGIIGLHRSYGSQIEDLQQQLDVAQQQSYQDSLTNLGNRHAFRRDLDLILNDENKLAIASLMMVRASTLQNINIQRGFQAGDQYLQDIVRLVRKAILPVLGARAYRISGTDIAVLAKGQCEPLAERLGTQLNQELYHYQHIHELDCAGYIGFTQLLPGQAAEQVLSRADLALAQSQTNEPNSWSLVLKNNDDEDMGESQWRQRLHSMLSEDKILLQAQPAQIRRSNMPGYNEIFTRFPNEQGGTYPATTVFAMLQRLNMSMLFEQKIIEMILQQIERKALPGQRWAINLTPASLQQNSFFIWLERVLLRNRETSASLVFELDEQVLQHQRVTGKRLMELIRRCGARSAVSRFGHGYGSFRLLKELKPDYIKLDGDLVRQLEEDSTNQQFVRMVVDLAQRLGCHVIAEGVETVEQKQLLESMHIDGIQGYLVAKPADFHTFKVRAAI
ncbi:EAL domain-containing protein (putative c-di-GMP-specific phosphodiesterase class I)/GGDEF domain-containing protein [Oceanisphaera litoralis]|uniref:EAL domain-containing protein n=1 Tax=Oceanisphaera litoralis TaxID=225144 RepID=UPI00195B272C|nr:GGDEF domain-containing protein [Oceanisphaera litoralis]MBM7454997.1 EAL domain-containing protein (putative c-di-GMP-specific phosphodiesterase class I)/GGDEF domain-containing protein [Oceanisphaera litoralis]